MKKLIVIIFLVCTSYQVGAAGDILTSKERDWLSSHGPLRIGVADYAPFYFEGRKGQVQGMAIDLWQLVSLKLHMQVDFIPVPFGQTLEGILSGRFDSSGGLFNLERRKNDFEFTEYFTKVNTNIYTRHDVKDVECLEDLKKCLVAVVKGDSAEYIAKNNDLKYKAYSSYAESFLSMINYDTEAALMDDIVVMYYTNKFGLHGDIKKSGGTIEYGKLCFPVKNGNKILLSILNKGINKVSDEEWKQIEQKWLGIAAGAEKFVWLKKLIPFLIVSLFICIIWVFMLRYQIRRALKQERKQIKTIKKIYETLTCFIESIPFAAAMLDANGIVLYANSYMAEFGAENIKPINNLRLNKGFKQLLHQAIYSNNPWKWTGIFESKTLQAELIPVFGKQEFVLLIQDITLEQEVSKVREQEEAARTLQTMVGGLAHNYNNLLQAIQSGFENMKSDLGMHKAQKQIIPLEKALNQAIVLTRGLLTLTDSRLVQKKSFCLNLEVENLSQVFRAGLASGMELRVALSGELAWTSGDLHGFGQTFLNLLVNARDALGEVGIMEVSIKPAVLNQFPFWELVVCDNGPGIASEIIDNIFEPLFSTKEPGKGSGLGLYMTKRYMQNIGGHIDVVSRPGKTCFSLFFPKAKPVPESVSSRNSKSEALNLNVLLVDDDELVRETGADSLEYCGAKVVQAESGYRALEILHEHGQNIDLVVMDIVMPGMDGIQCLGLIRKDFPQLPVILTSGFDQAELKELQLDLKTKLLPKPYKSSALEELIAAIF